MIKRTRVPGFQPHLFQFLAGGEHSQGGIKQAAFLKQLFYCEAQSKCLGSLCFAAHDRHNLADASAAGEGGQWGRGGG